MGGKRRGLSVGKGGRVMSGKRGSHGWENGGEGYEW